MARRKNLLARTPTGQLQRRQLLEVMPPTEVRRLLDASRKGLRDAVWSSALGELHVRGKISAAQFAAGRAWLELIDDYGKATQAPKEPRSAKLEKTNRQDWVDPDSAAGRKEARRHAKTVERYLAGQKLLRFMGEATEAAVADVCERDIYAITTFQLAALRGGLSALAALWGSK